jgi:hypothetical protein
MPDIEQEIQQVADGLEKSTQTPKERLFETIRHLGPAELRARMAGLEKSEKELLLDALTEMKKAVEMDKEYAAEYVQGKLKATKIQEDKADDDQDEKLVFNSPEAVTVNHQGTPTNGWEGQVIKGKKDMSDKKEPKDSKIKEAKNQPEDAEDHQLRSMKKSVEILKKHGAMMLEMYPDDIEKAHVGFAAVSANAAKHGADDPDAVAAAVGRKKYGKEGMAKLAEAGKKKEMKKGEDMEKAYGEGMCKKQGVPEGIDPAKQERCVRKLKGEKGKNAYAICNASMKKGLPVTTEVKEALLEIKKSIEEQLQGFGQEATPELIKAEMKRLLKEEDQDGDAPEMNVKTRANKEDVAALDLAEDNKKAQKKVDDEKQGQKGEVKKAIWGGENDLLKANTNGRNFHFSMEEHLAWLEVSKAGVKVEDLNKSSEKKDDLNDIIAKSQDTTWGHIECETLIKANDAKRGKVFKSFENKEIQEALGLTDEEARKILGE